MQEKGEQPQPPILIDIGQVFHPFALPQEEYYGFSYHDLRAYRNPQALRINLRTGILPNLAFDIISIPPVSVSGKTDIYIESNTAQAIELGLVHKTGRRTTAFPSHQPYGFNIDILPIIQQLRFKFIDTEGDSEAKADETALHREGKIQFLFIANADALNQDLGAVFILDDSSIRV